MQITIVGLGIKQGDISLNGQKVLLSNKKVLVRTALTESYETIKELGIEHTSLDYVYEKSRTFDTLCKNLVNEVIEFSKTEDVVYCVDGSVAEDNSAKEIIKRHKDTLIIDGVSRISAYLSKAGLSSCKYTSVSAYELNNFIFESLPIIVYDIDSSFLAGDVKLKLCSAFGDEISAKFMTADSIKNIKLFELDRQTEYNYSCAVVIDNVPLAKKERFQFGDLVQIIKRLREPDGCPWDKVQTNESIRINTIEEAYELVDAVDSGDDDKILEESGDVLLQSVFHAVMKEEQGAFSVDDMLSNLCKKLVDRHTHIFGEDKAVDAKQALSVWEKNKSIEKNQATASDAVKDVPQNFPSVMFAQKVQKRAAKGGFEYADINGAILDLNSEVNELLDALKNGSQNEISLEAGDLLFSAVNVARMANVECEMALKDSANKFSKRFIETERLIIADKKALKDLSLEEMNEYYKKAKQNVG